MHLSPPQSALHRRAGEKEPTSSAASGLIGPVGLELRQVSGLDAGASHPLSAAGVYYTGQPTTALSVTTDSGHARDGRGFRLDADADGEIVLTPLGPGIRLDDRIVDGPTLVGTAVIDLGYASFVVAQKRADTERGRSLIPNGARKVGGLQHDRLPPAESVVEVPTANPSGEELASLVALAHRHATEHRRFAWPDPEEVTHHAITAGSRLWTRAASHPLFGHVAVAHGSVRWHARMEHPVRVDTNCRLAIQNLSSLTAVPLATDLTSRPLGIVGPRDSALAVARHAVLTLATLSPPSDLRIALHANHRTGLDWEWADALPHFGAADLVGTNLDTALLTIVDHPNPGREIGDIIVTDDVAKLPECCDDVVIVAKDGTCTVLDHRAEVMAMGSSPLGIGTELAAAAALALRQTLQNHEDHLRLLQPKRRSRFTGMVRQLTQTSRPARTDFRRPPIGSTPTPYGYEFSFF